MKRLVWASVALAAACASAPQDDLTVADEASAEQKAYWSASAEADLRAAHAAMLANHPGPVDPANPGFMDVAEKALRSSLELAARAETDAGYDAVLASYQAAFRDDHFQVYRLASDADPEDRWPGFIVSYRPGEGFTVVDTGAETSFLRDAELLSCDGQRPGRMLDERVFAFSSGKPDQDAYRVYHSRRLFLDDGNPFLEPMRRCRFRLSNGRLLSHQLEWLPVPVEIYQRTYESTFGADPERAALREVEPGVFWINLPNFAPNEGQVNEMRAVFAEVEERREELRAAKAVVVDVRGNKGGNSAWGNTFVEALWGAEFLANHQPPASRGVDWRVSDGNIQHLDDVVPVLRSQGLGDVVDSLLLPIINGMKAARDNGEPFFFEQVASEERGLTRPLASPEAAPVYFLTAGTCASSCLDFADLMLSIDGVRHIGFPTQSDTLYLEVREETLPEERAAVILPIKVFRDRPRGDSEALIPQDIYNGTDWSDEAIEAWVLELLAI